VGDTLSVPVAGEPEGTGWATEWGLAHADDGNADTAAREAAPCKRERRVSELGLDIREGLSKVFHQDL